MAPAPMKQLNAMLLERLKDANTRNAELDARVTALEALVSHSARSDRGSPVSSHPDEARAQGEDEDESPAPAEDEASFKLVTEEDASASTEQRPSVPQSRECAARPEQQQQMAGRVCRASEDDAGGAPKTTAQASERGAFWEAVLAFISAPFAAAICALWGLANAVCSFFK